MGSQEGRTFFQDLRQELAAVRFIPKYHDKTLYEAYLASRADLDFKHPCGKTSREIEDTFLDPCEGVCRAYKLCEMYFIRFCDAEPDEIKPFEEFTKTQSTDSIRGKYIKELAGADEVSVARFVREQIRILATRAAKHKESKP